MLKASWQCSKLRAKGVVRYLQPSQDIRCSVLISDWDFLVPMSALLIWICHRYGLQRLSELRITPHLPHLALES